MLVTCIKEVWKGTEAFGKIVVIQKGGEDKNEKIFL
jgi:hypothetical protein